MTDKVRRAQAFIEGLTVAEMIMEFRREFRGVYDESYMNCPAFTAVGPCQSFIGFCIQKGYLEVVQKETSE